MIYLQHKHTLNWRVAACRDAALKMSPCETEAPHTVVLRLCATQYIKLDIFPIIHHTVSLRIQEYFGVPFSGCFPILSPPEKFFNFLNNNNNNKKVFLNP